VVMKALERDPDKRYASCAELSDALERASGSRVAVGRDISIYVSEVLGQEISQQREAVRTWLARSEPSRVALPDLSGRGRISSSTFPPPSSSTVAAAVMSLPQVERSDGISEPILSGVASSYPRPSDSKRVLIAIAACLAALLAGAVIVLLMTPPTSEATFVKTVAVPKAAKTTQPATPQVQAASPPKAADNVPTLNPLPEPTREPEPEQPAAERRKPAVRGRAPVPDTRASRPAVVTANPRVSDVLDRAEKFEKPERIEKKPDDVNLTNPYRR
jgi:hypothetical protein